MRRKFWLALAAAAAFVPMLSSPVHAGEGERHHGRHPEARLEKSLAELGLTPAQDEKVRAILEQAKVARQPRREAMRAEFERMHELLEADAPDEAAVLAQADKISALKNEQHKAMLKTLLAIRAELTPEQRAELKAKMREHGHGKRWFRGGPKGEPAPEAAPDES
jgi:Spy/CpxP family protein refolding chaperone